MSKITFSTPVRVGDLNNGITVDEMELVSLSLNWQPQPDPKGNPTPMVTVSVILQHLASGWTHNICLRDDHPGDKTKTTNGGSKLSTVGTDKLAQIEAAIAGFRKTILTLMADQLPAGTIAE